MHIEVNARRKIALLLLTLFGVATATVCTARQRGLPPIDGIVNFGKVNEKLCRGAQPNAEALRSLKQRGVKAIINLQKPGEIRKAEEVEAAAKGILYTNIPLSGSRRPTDEQVKEVLQLIETLPKPVFVHCKRGCDRTGTIIACYRIQHDRWSSQAALREAVLYGMSKLERGMKRYIVDFGKAEVEAALVAAGGPTAETSGSKLRGLEANASP